MDFDPSTAVLDAPAPASDRFDPSTARPDAAPQTPKVDPDALFSGLDNLKGPQWDALDRVSANPKESRAMAVNQSYWGAQGVPTTNWPASRLGIAQSRFGYIGKEISDEQLYGLQQKKMADDKKSLADGGTPWHWLSDSTAGLLNGPQLPNRPPRQPDAIDHFLQSISKPLAELPEPTDEQIAKLPLIPTPVMPIPPRVLAMAYKLWRPTLEGFTSPGNIALMATGAGLEKGALEGSEAAATALKGMSGVFTAIMAKASKDGKENIDRIKSDPNHTTWQLAQAYAQEGANVLMALGASLGAVHTQAPEALKAMEGKPIEEAPPILQEAAKQAKTPEDRAAITSSALEVQKVASANDTPPQPPPAAQPPEVPGEQVKTETAEPAVEPAPAAESPLVGIKNAVVDEEMAKMGLDPAEHGESLTAEQVVGDAMAKLKADPMSGAKLVSELADNPRPVTGQETALILTEKNRLSIERDRIDDALERAKSDGNQDAVAELQVKQAQAQDAYIEAGKVATKVGTPQAQGLVFRKLMMAEDYSVSGMEAKLAAEKPDSKITPDERQQIKDLSKRIRQTDQDFQKHEASRLKAYKTRLKKGIEEYKSRVALGDLSPKPKPEPVELDLEGEILKAAHERAKQEFETMVVKERYKQQNWYQKGMNTLVKWRRGFLLSSPITLGKLTAAAGWRIATTTAEEGVGTVLSKIPGFSKVAEDAPRYGAGSMKALSHSIAAAWSQGAKDAWQLLKTGKSNLDVIYGRGKDPAVAEYDVLNRSVIDFFGSIHGALKSPVKRFEFTLSLEKRIDHAMRHEVDVTNPLVQTRLAMEAYKDANRSIFLQDNMLSDAFKRGLSAFEQTDKTTKKQPLAGKAFATAAKIALPIVKVPTNIAGEAFEYATGLETGSYQLARALHSGVDKLTPAQKDLIMRHLQKGLLGTGGLLLGYFGAENVGGYWQPGDKRPASDVKAGDVRVFGAELPQWALHIPLMETVQLGATVRRVAESKFRKKDKDVVGLGEGIWAGLLGLTEEVPFARETTEVGKIFGGGPEGRYARDEFVKGLAVPQLLQFIATRTDKDAKGQPIARKPDTLLEHLETGIPGLREKVPERKTAGTRAPSTYQPPAQ